MNESRARRVELSRDRYSHLWVSDSTRRLWEDFSREVYPLDEIELGARNRFFLERLEAFIEANHDAVFVNFGAGFTSYPFLTERRCRCIEIDYEHVLAFKREKTTEWRREGLLPERDVEFLAADLRSEAERRKLREELDAEIGGRPSLFMMEGITYYLDPAVLNAIFEMSKGVQSRGSHLTFDFWTPESETHPVFIRFSDFFERRFGHQRTDYNFLDVDFVGSLSGYELVELTDIQRLERSYSNTRLLSDYRKILPESYAVLRRV